MHEGMLASMEVRDLSDLPYLWLLPIRFEEWSEWT